MIKVEQQILCEKLYIEGNHTIKEIMDITGIRSEQTIYRILDAAEIPRRPSRKAVHKISLSIDKDTMEIIKKENPKNISEWICNIIKDKYSI